MMRPSAFERAANLFRGYRLTDDQLQELVTKVIAPCAAGIGSKYRVRLETKTATAIGQELHFGAHWSNPWTWTDDKPDSEGMTVERTADGISITAGNRWESYGRDLNAAEIEQLKEFLNGC